MITYLILEYPIGYRILKYTEHTYLIAGCITIQLACQSYLELVSSILNQLICINFVELYTIYNVLSIIQ